MKYSPVQKQRLIELGQEQGLDEEFSDSKARDESFRLHSRNLENKNKEALQELQQERRPHIKTVEDQLLRVLYHEGFAQVSTPVMMSKGLLQKMGLHANHPLWRQLFWVDKNKCLRPMLAPHLYYLLRQLQKNWEPPVKIFEVGPVFRRESKGTGHVEEFTMLNLVCLGCTDPQNQLNSAVEKLFGQFDKPYSLVTETSEVYGETLDVNYGDIEAASTAIGPHPLDVNWDISGAWYGIGIGLERLTMALYDHANIRRVSKSLSYQNGARLNI